MNSREQSVADAFEMVLNESAPFMDTAFDILKDESCSVSVPFVSFVAKTYHIGKTIRERHHLDKLITFIKEIAEKTIDEKKREKYLIGWHADYRKREKELEYLIVIIDRFLHKEMAQKLARVYLAYLENRIDWEEVLRYSVVIDRLLPGDFEALTLGNRKDVEFTNAEDTVLRLVGLGLMVAHGKNIPTPIAGTVTIPNNSNTDYDITEFGKVFLSII